MPPLTTKQNHHRNIGSRRSVTVLAQTFLVCAVLSSCNTSPVSPSSNTLVPIAIERTPTNIRTDQHSTSGSSDWQRTVRPLFLQAKNLVEQYTGETLANVTLKVANDGEITREVSHETSKLIHSQFSNKRFAQQFLNAVMQGQKGTYAALYATRIEQVMVSQPLMQSYQQSLPSTAGLRESAVLALLIHELVHAADDKRYGIHDNRQLNFRASFAQSAAYEGHAQYVTREICKKANCLDGLQALDNFMFGSRNPPNKLTQSVQAVSRNVLEYSYVEGERFVTHLANQPNGRQLLDRLLSKPPQDPIQILDPGSFPNTAREQRNQELLAVSTSFNHPWLSGSWASVQTSPLKGVNLRTDPARRDAAVDGFTRLITSMVALQLYDQSSVASTPIELTVLRTESNETAELFAQTLHENTLVMGAEVVKPESLMKVNAQLEELPPARMFVTTEPTVTGETYYTLIGVSANNVVQISGVGESQTLFVDYLDKLLIAMSTELSAPTHTLRKARL